LENAEFPRRLAAHLLSCADTANTLARSCLSIPHTGHVLLG
jgi:hypothetical protein